MTGVRYIVCATPRSGSNLLCDLLESCGAMGRPREFLNVPAFVAPYAEKHELTAAEGDLEFNRYLDHIVANFSSHSGVFGMKTHFDQLEPYLRLPAARELLTDDVRFVWLLRKDVAAQAVSMYIAQQTDEWTSWDEDRRSADTERVSREAITFDEERIRRALREIQRQNSRWLELFAVNQFDFHIATYEDLLADPQAVCASICHLCGVEVDHRFAVEESRFTRQGDELNERLLERLRASSDLLIDQTLEATSVDLRGLRLAG
jgi:LPS sulfotransferase NodH